MKSSVHMIISGGGWHVPSQALVSVGIWKCSTMPCSEQLMENPPNWKVRFYAAPLQGSSKETSPRASVVHDDEVPNETT